MLKYLIYILLAAVVIGLIGSGVHLWRVARKNEKEMAPYAGEPVAVTKNLGRVLVVYYSLSGHTREIAEKIRQVTGGDLYEIKTTEKLDSSPWYYLTLRSQLKSGNYPSIENNFPQFAAYDTIFVGAPVWWYTIATPVLSFLQQADFGGKKVVPFSTQGSNYGTFFEDFAARAQNASLAKGASAVPLHCSSDIYMCYIISVFIFSLSQASIPRRAVRRNFSINSGFSVSR